MSRTPLIRALLIGCLATVLSGCGDIAAKLPKQTGHERAAFVHRIETACTARTSDLHRLKSPRTRKAYLASFAARRLVEAEFQNSVGQIVPPKGALQPFQRLTHAAQARVDAVDRFHEAVLARKLGEGRAAFAETRSDSLVIAREAKVLGASCPA
ncbi:MAG: hypothetical protein QOK32_167 [Gaiellaceae bacterium]|nr:hypothetical protein [Gaiellaceae bacterium]